MIVAHQLGLARAATLGVLVCLVAGCATASRHAEKASPTPKTGDGEALLGLTDAQQRRAEALAHYSAGISLEMTRGMNSALDEYERSLELDPQNTGLVLRIADYFLNRKEFAKATALLEKAIKLDPNRPDLLFGLGVAYKAGDQADKAIDVLRQALKRQPTNLRAIQMMFETEMAKPVPVNTIKALDQAWTQSSKDPYYWTRLGDLYALLLKQKPSAAGQIDRSRILQSYQKALALAPKEVEILLRLGDLSFDAGDFKTAGETFAQVLALQPDTPEIRLKLVNCYVRAGQKEKAATVLEELIKRDPLRFQLYIALAEVLEELNQDEKAISNYRQSLVIKPDQLAPYLRISLLQSQAKKFDDALKTLSTAKQKYPTAYQVPYFSGLVLNDKKDYAPALAAFTEAEKLAQEQPEQVKLDSSFYFYFGAACERSGDIERAVVLFRKSIELDPERAGAYNYLGYMWADKGIHLDEAHELIKKAVAKDPDNSSYIDSLGWVLFKLGKNEEALVQLRHAADLMQKEKSKDNPLDDGTVFDHLAEVLLKLGKRDEAVRQLRHALQIEPNNKDIAEKLHKLTADQTTAPQKP